jgi:hypothetical protein
LKDIKTLGEVINKQMAGKLFYLRHYRDAQGTIHRIESEESITRDEWRETARKLHGEGEFIPAASLLKPQGRIKQTGVLPSNRK